MAVALVQLLDREQRIDPLLERLADADEDARREGDLQPARCLDRGEPLVRHLVRAAVVRLTLAQEPRAHRLEHDPRARAHLSQRGDVLLRQDARVDVREQTGLAIDEVAHVVQVGKGGRIAEFAQPVAVRGILQLRLISQAEERLLAARPLRRVRRGQHHLRRHRKRVGLARLLHERAVAADVAAEVCQRDEHFARVGDNIRVRAVAQQTRRHHERGHLGARSAN